MASTLPETITVDGVTLSVSVERKRVKNVNARLQGSTLRISAPPGMASEELEATARKLARRLLRRSYSQQANVEEEAVNLANTVAGRFPKPPSVERVMFVANQRSRWGSYSQRTRTIRLNVALQSMPRWVLEAVVAHELAHAIHPDHSPDFWELLRSACPETDQAQAFLTGVSWLGTNWQSLSGIELSLLAGTGDEQARE